MTITAFIIAIVIVIAIAIAIATVSANVIAANNRNIFELQTNKS